MMFGVVSRYVVVCDDGPTLDSWAGVEKRGKRALYRIRITPK